MSSRLNRLVLSFLVSCLGGVMAMPAFSADQEAVRQEFLELAREFNEGNNPYIGYAQVKSLRAKVADDSLSSDERTAARLELADHCIRVGYVDEAIEVIDGLFAETQADAIPADWHYLRGLAYLRLSEVENCIVNHNQECCVFPLEGGGLHSNALPAQEAIKSFRAYLESNPDDGRVHWVLNVLAMALNDFPGGVDPAYRIRPELFDSDYDLGRFENIAPLLGVDAVDLAGGSVADDFTGDGLLDIIASSNDPNDPLQFFRNLGNGAFEDAKESSGLNAQLGGLNLIHGDFDNDGHIDLFVLRGAWFRLSGRQRNSLLRNNGDGTFTDVTREAGVALPEAPVHSALFFDYNNNGLLDLFVGNEDLREVDPKMAFPSNLFRNNGDGTFTDVAAEAGITVDRYVKGVAAGDYNNNGWLDLYVSILHGPNHLYRNNGDGTFTEVAAQAGVTEPAGFSHQPAFLRDRSEAEERGASFPAFFFDFDNDGWLDLMVGDFTASQDELQRHYRGEPMPEPVVRLYRNNGDGTFEDVTVAMGLVGPYRVMGMGFGDLENNGWLDIYLATGKPDYMGLMPNAMFRNNEGRGFQNVTTSGGFGNLQKGHGVSFADFNNNGFQDIYNQQGGAYPGDRYQNALYRNPGGTGGFLHVELRGEESNHFGVGTRVTLTVSGPGGERSIHRVNGLGSSFGGNPMSRLEIGIGSAERIDRMEVWWPASGVRSVYEDVPTNSLVRVREGADSVEKLPLKAFPYRTRPSTAALTQN